MALQHIHAFDDNFALARQRLDDFAGHAFAFACENHYIVAFFYGHVIVI
jgi:hypothetical protein